MNIQRKQEGRKAGRKEGRLQHKEEIHQWKIFYTKDEWRNARFLQMDKIPHTKFISLHVQQHKCKPSPCQTSLQMETGMGIVQRCPLVASLVQPCPWVGVSSCYCCYCWALGLPNEKTPVTMLRIHFPPGCHPQNPPLQTQQAATQTRNSSVENIL